MKGSPCRGASSSCHLSDLLLQSTPTLQAPPPNQLTLAFLCPTSSSSSPTNGCLSFASILGSIGSCAHGTSFLPERLGSKQTGTNQSVEIKTNNNKHGPLSLPPGPHPFTLTVRSTERRDSVMGENPYSAFLLCIPCNCPLPLFRLLPCA